MQLADKSGRELSAAELEAQIEKIIALAGSEKATPVGALTSDNRDNWADVRIKDAWSLSATLTMNSYQARAALLAASQSNAASLEEIESAILVVALDDTKPVTREQISWGCWVGDGKNRFYDKHQCKHVCTLTLYTSGTHHSAAVIVYENGKSGFLGEHSCMDGTPTLRLNEFILAALAAGKVDLSPAPASAALEPPQELTFTLDGKTREYIAQAEKNFDTLVGQHDMEVLHYEGYGKEHIKAFKASPDAWAQMVKQLAFHKMFGRPGVCYESAQTRKYQLGRTEVIRSASNESKAWAEAMLDPTQTVRRFFLAIMSVCTEIVRFRTSTVPPSSARPSHATCNTPHGLRTARALTATSSGSRSYSRTASLSPRSTPTRRSARRTTGSFLRRNSPRRSSTAGAMARSCPTATASRTQLGTTTSAGRSRA